MLTLNHLNYLLSSDWDFFSHYQKTDCIISIFKSSNGVTLKSGLGVVQGHCKWRHSIDHIRFTVILSLCVYVTIRSFIFYRFRVIWRWIISWFVTLKFGLQSLKVIHLKALVRFPIRIPGNYGSILYHFWDKAIYWPKIAIFSYSCIRRPR